MSRLRFCVTSLAVAAGAGFFISSARSHAQTSSSRSLLTPFAPPAIERGVNPVMRPPRGTAVVSARDARPGPGPDRVSVSGARYRSNRVIVRFKDAVSSASRATTMSAVARSSSMQPRRASQNFDIVELGPGEDAESTAGVLRGRADVEYAQAAYRNVPMFVPNDALYPRQWDLPLIGMERAWDVQPAAGSAITVAVLDTGVAFKSATLSFLASGFCKSSGGDINSTPCVTGETTYPALGSITLQFAAATELAPLTRFVAPRDFIWNDDSPLDLDGHGTHVSGTIGQLTNNGANGLGDVAHGGGTAGVAFNVRIMPVKVLDTEWDDIFGSPNIGTDDIVALGIRYAADNGAKVINMSLGRNGPANCGGNPNQNGCAPVVEDAIRYAVGKGVFVAVASGNKFASGNPTEIMAEIASRVQGAVSVAAVNPAGGHASYSTVASYVEIAAPGGDFGSFGAAGGVLQQTLDLDLVDTFDLAPSKFARPRFDSLAYFSFTGTSMATPHVAGVAAMLMQQGITSPAAIEAALERFALPCSESANSCNAGIAANRNQTFGFGLLQAAAALRGLGLAK